MKAKKCYNCKYAGNQFKLEKLTHLHCLHVETQKEDPSPWNSLRVFSDSCELHENNK